MSTIREQVDNPVAACNKEKDLRCSQAERFAQATSAEEVRVVSGDSSIHEDLHTLANDVNVDPGAAERVLQSVTKRKRRNRLGRAVTFAAVVAIGGGGVLAVAANRSNDSSGEAESASSGPASTTSTPTASSPDVTTEPTVRPFSREKLARHQILVEETRRRPAITADEAVLRAADGLVPSPRPAAELYTVTVDGLGREDRSAPGGYQNLIQDRLVWVVTFPSKLVSHGGDMFSGPTGGYSQSVVLMDAMTGEFLFADSYPG